MATDPVILIVDDLSSARKVVAKLLMKAGYKNVREAKDGAEALKLLASEPISLIISDWDMPQISGIELVKKLRSDDKTKTLPFIMITSSSGKNEVMEALHSGVSDYVAKPFDSATLCSKIEKFLGTLNVATQ